MVIQTFDYLETIGFIRVEPTSFATVKLRLYLYGGHADAVESTTVLGVPIVQLMGSCYTGRTAHWIDFSLPPEVESEELLLALLAYNLRNVDFDTPPDWFTRGMALQDELPWRKEYALRQQAPQCSVSYDYFKVLEQITRHRSKDASTDKKVELSYDGTILRLVIDDELLVAPATGKAWEKRHFILLKDLQLFPKRIRKRSVSFVIWEDKLLVNGYAVPLLKEDDDNC